MLNIDQKTGIVVEASYFPSPNHDDRPADTSPTLIVLHNISLPPGQFNTQDVVDFFCNRLAFEKDPYYKEIQHLKVASHVLITRKGEIYQFVPFHLRAWHAGESQYQGREKCNDFSIGIELEGTDELPYTDQQYEKLHQLILGLLKSYPTLSSEHITGHSDIAPQRKTDPGPSFDWQRLRKAIC